MLEHVRVASVREFLFCCPGVDGEETYFARATSKIVEHVVDKLGFDVLEDVSTDDEVRGAR